MNKTLLLSLIAVFLSGHSMLAQFVDGFEWSSGDCPEQWLGNPPIDCPAISDDFVHSGLQSGYINQIDGSTEAILDLGNKSTGGWNLIFWMYIPSGNEGYFSIQGEVPIGLGEKVVGDIFFNKDGLQPGEGVINDSALGEVLFNFPHDQWFRVIMVFDLSLGMNQAKWWLYIFNTTVIPIGTPLTNEAGNTATSLGGIQFLAPSTNPALSKYYLDDFIFNDEPLVLDVELNKEPEFYILPNPTKDDLKIVTDLEFNEVQIINQFGQKVESFVGTNLIDLSKLSSGIYLVKLITKQGVYIQKVIKN